MNGTQHLLSNTLILYEKYAKLYEIEFRLVLRWDQSKHKCKDNPIRLQFNCTDIRNANNSTSEVSLMQV